MTKDEIINLITECGDYQHSIWLTETLFDQGMLTDDESKAVSAIQTRLMLKHKELYKRVQDAKI